jgi:Zn-dependent protease
MSWSIKFARVAGIDLKIHFTFLLFLIWIGFTYLSIGGVPAARNGVLFILLLFGCVLLHELGHALTAQTFDIRTTDITLLPIGGVARLERIPEEPKQELLIAIAGPLVNVVIAFLLIFYLGRRASMSDFEDLNTPRVAMLSKLASVNIGLVLFNLIPAFPMDGGRILRSILAMRTNYVRATEIAARIGQALAVVFGIIGFFLRNFFLVFIAFFVYTGAAQEAAMARARVAYPPAVPSRNE